MMCPHGGTVQVTTSNTRSKAVGDFLLRDSDTFQIVGCPFQVVPPTPHPCVSVNWSQPAAKSKAGGDATLTEQSVGMCVAADQAVQGTVQIVFTQPRVSGI
jgi:hypothetical protein